MAKKLSIPVSLSEEYTIIGIACHLKEYRISFQINQALRIRLRRMEDLLIEEADVADNKQYALYSYDDMDRRFCYLLLTNHHQEGKLLGSLKQTDYFLIISQILSQEELERIILRIRKVQGVLTAYQIHVRDVRDMDLLLIDLEMHLMTA